MSSDSKPRRKLSLGRKIAFSLIPTLLLLALLGILEIALRAFGTEASDDPFINLQLEKSIFRREDRDGVPHLRVWHPQAYGSTRKNEFSIQKPNDDTLRIFCVGGSACAGWPHPEKEDFADYLQHALAQAYPDRTVQVINTAAHGFAAYRVRRVYQDVADCDPDAIIVYSGNNEFLEERQYSGVRALLGGSYVMRMASAVVGKFLYPENALSGWGTAEQSGISDIVGKIEQIALNLRSDPEQLKQVLAHYEFCIEDMIQTGETKATRTYLLTVPSNLRDWHPNVSQHGPIADETKVLWDSSYRAGQQALLSGDLEAAKVALSAARETSPGHAETAFWLGRVLERRGDETSARAEFAAAKDLDLNPFRALTATNTLVRDIAARHAGATLIDMVRIFEQAADGASPGHELFLDYVHPTKRGNMLLAKTLFDRILDDRLVDAEPATRDFVMPPSEFDVRNDVETQRLLMQLAVMMHQETTAQRSARAILGEIEAGRAVVRNPVGEHQTLPDFQAFFTDALAHLDAFLEAERASYLGEDHPADFRARLQQAHREFFFPDVFQALEAKKLERRN